MVFLRSCVDFEGAQAETYWFHAPVAFVYASVDFSCFYKKVITEEASIKYMNITFQTTFNTKKKIVSM